LEAYALSKAWYFAQVMPLPEAEAANLRRLITDFLWLGRLGRLAYDELHGLFSAGGLHLSCFQTRAQALLVKQAAHQLGAGGQAALHLSYWLGAGLQPHFLEILAPGPYLEGRPPPQFSDLGGLILEALSLPCVEAGSLLDTKSALVYKAWTETTPTPRIERIQPDLPWDLTWPRLAGPFLDPPAVDLHFSLLHGLLPVQARLHRLQLAASATCLHCPAMEADILHSFTQCPRVAPAWAFLLFRATLALGVALTDRSLLFLAWPPTPADREAVLAVVTFSLWAWQTREDPATLPPPELATKVAEAAAAGPLASILR
jgi:hypothetical protein